MSSRDKVKNAGIALLLAASLLFGQWLAFSHKLNLDGHPAGHVCEWCVAHAGLDHLIADSAPPAPALAAAVMMLVIHHAGVRLPQVVYYPARAPPVLSFL